MTGFYSGWIKVVGVDLMCFRAHPQTLEPRSCGCHDPYAWTDPDPDPVETICISEWQRRRASGQKVPHSPTPRRA